jgi:hypothetical protein
MLTIVTYRHKPRYSRPKKTAKLTGPAIVHALSTKKLDAVRRYERMRDRLAGEVNSRA